MTGEPVTPDRLHEALGRLTRALPGASLDDLRSLAAALRSALPSGSSDLDAVTDGIVATLQAADEGVSREILIAQLEGDLSAVAMLAGALASATPPTALAVPAWVDAAMLAEFHEAQRSGLSEVEEVFLGGRIGESDRKRIARVLHTLKGEAGTVGFTRLEELYHALEDHLDGLKDLSAVVDDVFAVKDWVLTAVPALVRGEGEPPGYPALLARLRPADPPAPGLAPVGPAAAGALPSDPEVVALFGEFHDESQESLLQADELLMSLEGAAVDPSTVDALFRIFHTIKGLAGFLDMGSIGVVAHAAETLLDLARENPATLDQHRIDLLLRTTVMVRRILGAARVAIDEGTELPALDGYAPLLDGLVAARTGAPAPALAPAS